MVTPITVIIPGESGSTPGTTAPRSDLTELTHAVCAKLFRGEVEVRSYQVGRPFRVGEFRVEPFLIVEANHDERLLRSGPYPPSVQARIASSHGHLSNHAAADFARELLHPRGGGILLAHLSAECNRPELALEVVGRILRRKGYQGYLAAAGQDEPTELLEFGELRERCGPGQLSLL